MTPRRRNIEIKSLFYITHIDNVKSILDNGVFSHQLMEERGLPFTPIYDMDIVSNRKHKHTPSGKSLWNYANVYFQARNPMLYRVVLEKDYKNLAVVALKPSILQIPGAFITNGNAANEITAFYDYKSGMKVISDIWSTIMGEWWNSLDGSKRRIMSECLIPERIPADYIHSVYVADHAVAQKIAEIIPGTVIPIIPEPNMFFIPKRRYQVSRNLLLAEGDMFFSNMQTLTISVNVVGVMGKGLASRAKYQFPDVYVVYQDACRNKKLKMGKPFLYKRESSLDEELMDEPKDIVTPNGKKWFLLFATKRHWREDSDLSGIEEGMKWLADNYKSEGIQSLAMPALGCGLGNLDWKDVGPVMCKYLNKMDITTIIYLPREKEIPSEFFKAEYLLA